MKRGLDINLLEPKGLFRPGPILLDDDKPEPAIILDIPGPGDQLKPHAPSLQEGLGVHGLVGRVEQKDEMLFGQGHPSRRLWGAHIFLPGN